MVKNPILLALDVADADRAWNLAQQLRDRVGGFKIGLELFMGPGPKTVSKISELGLPIFCDVKLHDIPTTVNRAARQLGELGARWITVHASGGIAQMQAASEGLVEGARGTECGVLAVTVLTSTSRDDLQRAGVTATTDEQVALLSSNALLAGVEGVICAPTDLATARQAAPSLLRVTPGIRPKGVAAHDQTRIATPAEAVRDGADYLVIGRAITAAGDPGRAADEILDSLKIQPARSSNG